MEQSKKKGSSPYKENPQTLQKTTCTESGLDAQSNSSKDKHFPKKIGEIMLEIADIEVDARSGEVNLLYKLFNQE